MEILPIILLFSICYIKLILSVTENVHSPSSENKVEELMDKTGLGLNETKDRLAIIFDRIDKNKNGIINEDEIEEWMIDMYIASGTKHAQAEIETIDTNGDGFAQWEELKEAMKDIVENGQMDAKSEDMLHKRFVIADEDQDGKLSAREFALLLNPGLSYKMQMLEAQEIMTHQDSNNDSLISFEEFLKSESDHSTDETSLNQDFKNYDLNKDNYIDLEEAAAVLKEPNSQVLTDAKNFVLSAGGPLKKSLWTEKWDELIDHVITDKGEILKTPDNYSFNEALPYSNVTIEDVEEPENDEL